MPPGLLEKWKTGYELAVEKSKALGSLEDVDWNISVGPHGHIALITDSKLKLLLTTNGKLDSFHSYPVARDARVAGWSDDGLPLYSSKTSIWKVGIAKPLHEHVQEVMSTFYEIKHQLTGVEEAPSGRFRWVSFGPKGDTLGAWNVGSVGEVVWSGDGLIACEQVHKVGRLEFVSATGRQSVLRSASKTSFEVSRQPEGDDLLISEHRYARENDKFAATTRVSVLHGGRLKPVLSVNGEFAAKKVAHSQVLGVHFDGWEMGASDLVSISIKTGKQTQIEHGVTDFIPF